MRKPHPARLVDAMEVDVNVYPPDPGWGGDPGRSLNELFVETLRMILAEAARREAAESPPEPPDETGEA